MTGPDAGGSRVDDHAVLVTGGDPQAVAGVALGVRVEGQWFAVQEEVGHPGADLLGGGITSDDRAGGDGLLHLVEGGPVALEVAVVVGEAADEVGVQRQAVGDGTDGGDRGVAVVLVGLAGVACAIRLEGFGPAVAEADRGGGWLAGSEDRVRALPAAGRAAAAASSSVWNAMASMTMAVSSSGTVVSVVVSRGPLPVSMQAYSGRSWCSEGRLRANRVRSTDSGPIPFRTPLTSWPRAEAAPR